MTELANHTTTWTTAEVDLLVSEWDTTPIEDIAEVLGRTVNACRQRYYEWTWGRTEAATTKAVAEGRTHHAAAAYQAGARLHRRQLELDLDRPVTACQSCWQVKAANGACGCTD